MIEAAAGSSHRVPLPPPELVERVTGSTDQEAFRRQGAQSVRDIEAALTSIGRSLGEHGSILDFGCGPGRVLAWLADAAPGASLHGSDIDARAVDWVRQNMPWVDARTNTENPPLGWPDGSFDLVYCHSVFTHLDEGHQDRWLEELRRVTRPGGTLVLSVHGEHAYAEGVDAIERAGYDPSSWHREMSERGILFVADDWNIGGPFPDFYHTTYHAPWYVFAHWGRRLRVRSYLARAGLGHQDYVVLERPPESKGDLPTVRPAGGGGGAPPPDAYAAVERAARLITEGPDPAAPARWGRLSRIVRRAAGRAAGHALRHHAEVDRALLDALQAVSAEALHAASAPAAPNHVNQVVRDVLSRQGERIRRLEEDMRQALEAAGAALDPPSSGVAGPSRGHPDHV